MQDINVYNTVSRRSFRMLLAAAAIILLVGIIWNISGQSRGNGEERSTDSARAKVKSRIDTNGPRSDLKPRSAEHGKNVHHRDSSTSDDIEKIRKQIRTLINAEGSWSKRLDRLSDLCRSLSKQAGVDRGLQIACDEAGPGEIRDWMITAIVEGSDCSFGEVMIAIRTIEGKNEIAAALIGLATKARTLNVSADELRKLQLSKNEMEALSLGFAMRVSAKQMDDKAFDVDDALELLSAASGGKVHDDVFGTFLDHLSVARPLDALELGVERLNQSKLEEFRLPALENVIANSMRVNPSSTMEVLLRDPRNRNRPEMIQLIRSSITIWLGINQSAATKWFDESKAGLDLKTTSTVAAELAELSIKTNDLENARQRAGEIKDPEIRSRIDGLISSSERDSLRKEVRKDPAATVGAIIAGQSQYGDYWLEEAMGTWVAMDFAKAQDWYQTNWNSLPANKSQYVAAAFANQAVGQGDFTTARQWAAYIHDPKTKQRIEAGITTAETQKNK